NDAEEIKQFIKTILLFFYDNSPQKRYLLKYIKERILAAIPTQRKTKERKAIEKKVIRDLTDRSDGMRNMLPSAKTLNKLVSQGYAMIIATSTNLTLLNSSLVNSNNPELQAWFDKNPLFVENKKGEIYVRHTPKRGTFKEKADYTVLSGHLRELMRGLGLEIYHPEEDAGALLKEMLGR